MTRCPNRDKGHLWTLRGKAEPNRSVASSVLLAPLWRRCNFCGAEDRETPLCEAQTASDMGRWTHFATCGIRAKVERAGKLTHRPYDGDDSDTHWYCGRHDPEAIAARRTEKHAMWEAEWKAKQARWDAEAKARVRLLKLEAAVEELLRWADENTDLVSADEWLAKILRSLT